MNDYNKKIVEEFKNNQGKVGGPFAHMKILLMTVKGAKTGKETVVPVAYTIDGDKYVVVASKGGAPTNPSWYYNLLANPDITVEVGTEKFQAHATNVTNEERERLFNQHAAAYPQFNGYRQKTTRTIPVFTLEKRS